MKFKFIITAILLCFILAFCACSAAVESGAPSSSQTAPSTTQATASPQAQRTLEQWKQVYQGVITDQLENKTKYAKEYFPEMESFAGINMFLMDLDGDSIPELLVGYINQGQMDYMYGYAVYKTDEKARSFEMLGPNSAETLPISSLVTLNDRHKLVSYPKASTNSVAYYQIHNEGSYDYALSLTEIRLSGDELVCETLYFLETPQDIVDKADEEITQYLVQEYYKYQIAQKLTLANQPMMYSGLIPEKQTTATFTTVK